jgi:uncharacterized coiled-coil protein SlyX
MSKEFFGASATHIPPDKEWHLAFEMLNNQIQGLWKFVNGLTAQVDFLTARLEKIEAQDRNKRKSRR